VPQDTEMLRRRWPEVLETVKGLRRATWILVGQNAQVHDLDSSVLRLSFPTAGLVDRFRDHSDVVARAVHETLGFAVHVQAVLAGADPGSSGDASAVRTPAEGNAVTHVPTGSPAATPPHGIPSAAQAAASWDAPAGPQPAASTRAAGAAAAPRGTARAVVGPTAGPAAPQAAGDEPAASPRAAGDEPDDDPSEDDDAPYLPEDDRDDPGDAVPEEPLVGAPRDDEPSPDDPVIEGSNLVGAPLVARLLGGTVIDEQVDPRR
jgi:DNA polymerase-3 subunit gamma/tau